jgi:hypothetical protein
VTGGRPGRRCTVCGRPHRGAVDAKLLAGHPQHVVAREHNLSADAVSRHFLRHLSAAAAIAGTLPPPAAATGSVDVLGTIGGLQGRLMGLLRVAERARDTRAAVAAIREARALLEMHGKLAGMIGADGTAILPAVPTTDAGCGPIRVRIAAKLDALASGQGAAE